MRTLHLVFVASVAVTACSSEQVTYDAPDATLWAPSVLTHWEGLDAGIALVTNNGSDTISLLNLDSQRSIGTWPVGVTPLDNNGPHHAVMDPIRRVFFTPLAFPAPAIVPGPHAAHGSSTTPGILIERSLDDFSLVGQTQVDPNPGDVVMSSDRTRIYVSHYDLVRAEQNVGNRAAQLADTIIIDATTMTPIASIPTCIAGHGMTLSLDGNTLYVACYGDDAIGVLTPLNGDHPTVNLVPLGATIASDPLNPTYGPYAIGRSRDGATIWLAADPPDATDNGTGPVFAFDVASQTFDGTRTVRNLPGNPFFPAFSLDGTTMVVPTQSRDAVVRVHLGAPSTIVDVHAYGSQCVLPHQVALGPDGRYYVVCEGIHGGVNDVPGNVLALDPVDLHVITNFPEEIYPDVIVFSNPP